MKFSVGYQFFDEHGMPFSDSICSMKECIEEVYFPWLDAESCRSSLINEGGKINWDAQTFLENDLDMLRSHGIKLNLLFNANCYGEKSVSNYLKNYVVSIIDHIIEVAGGLEFVTTTSPFIASIIKEQYSNIQTRASVNMRIGSIKGMQYSSQFFDGFYVQRDYNRNFEHIREMKTWADQNGKKLYLLANSGCMKFCSGQTFHDNVVAHEKGINEMNNVDGFKAAVCWDYYTQKENWVSLLQNTWIRPEDIYHYEDLFSSVKLATRMTSRPLAVVKAYINGKYNGNLLDLMEPNHSKLLGEYYLSNRRFPKDWFDKITSCSGNCHLCDFCNKVLEKVLVKTEEVCAYTDS